MAGYHNMEAPALELGLLAVSVVIAFLVHIGIKHWSKAVYCFVPKTTEYAKVRYVHAVPCAWNQRSGTETAHVHTAGFELKDGSRLKLHITHEDYIMLRAGSEGFLTRKGGWFLSFVPAKQADGMESPDILTREIE